MTLDEVLKTGKYLHKNCSLDIKNGDVIKIFSPIVKGSSSLYTPPEDYNEVEIRSPLKIYMVNIDYLKISFNIRFIELPPNSPWRGHPLLKYGLFLNTLNNFLHYEKIT